MRFFLLLACLIASPGFAADYYVSPKGNDANAGSLASPWKTVQKAADTLQPGDTVFVRRGTYRELVTIRVSGTAGAPITFAAFAGERPIIDATRIPVPEDDRALIYIEDRSHLVIRGFDLRNFSTAKPQLQPCGIFIRGAAHHIELRDNRISGIRTTHRDGNAFGIAVYGTSTTQPVTDLIIAGNEVHHLKTGNSESVALNGNVTGFAVTNNRVHDNNNIGIAFIGFEGTCPDIAQDRARDGVCRGNVVWNISSGRNPSYRGEFSADGIYCDGAARVLIERNVVSTADLGVELASEHLNGNCSDCILRDNVIRHCRVTGLGLGGYDAQRGATLRCTVTNNTFYQNDTRRTGSGEVLLQHYLTDNSIRQNIFFSGAQNVFVSNPATTNSGTVFDYNCYFSPRAAADSGWEWKQVAATGFAGWKTVSGQDTHSIFADPKFTSARKADFHLLPGSPAIDAGDPAFAAGSGEIDIDGATRVVGARVDLGVDEFAP